MNLIEHWSFVVRGLVPGNPALAVAACLLAVLGFATVGSPHISHVAFDCAGLASVAGFVNGVIHLRAGWRPGR